ncbi:hypothetical protein [Gordoniibacillus kamchatkensis]|nr:hypothetical protein [Paenibacillus sp. VKM B-2647]
MNVALSASLRQALLLLQKQLDGCSRPWLVGGSCGLLLQGVSVANPPRDIDMYADSDDADELHQRLQLYTVDEPAYSETPIYRSTLSHYDLHGHTLELVGGFVVEALGCKYAVDVALLQPYAASAAVGAGGAIRLMPLAHELLFNVLRGRPDRYEAVAAAMRREPERHLPVLRQLLARGSWSAEVSATVRELLKE